MTDFDNTTKETIKEHNPNWLYISDYLYRLSTIDIFRLLRNKIKIKINIKITKIQKTNT